MSAVPFARSTRRHARALLLVALVAFGVAQALAVAHSARHVGSDAAGLPVHHTQVCSDCATLLPLLSVAAGAAAALVFGPAVREALLPAADRGLTAAPSHRAFRPRAPPL